MTKIITIIEDNSITGVRYGTVEISDQESKIKYARQQAAKKRIQQAQKRRYEQEKRKQNAIRRIKQK